MALWPGIKQQWITSIHGLYWTQYQKALATATVNISCPAMYPAMYSVQHAHPHGNHYCQALANRSTELASLPYANTGCLPHTQVPLNQLFIQSATPGVPSGLSALHHCHYLRTEPGYYSSINRESTRNITFFPIHLSLLSTPVSRESVEACETQTSALCLKTPQQTPFICCFPAVQYLRSP